MQGILEGLLFVAGDEGMMQEKIVEILNISSAELEKLIEKLKQDYEERTRGICLEQIGNTLKLVTKKEHSAYYEKYFSDEGNSMLSSAALEVLAIIAYNAPVTRNMIDEIRGISSSHLIRKLLAKDLIEIKGKSDLPGKPNLYGVTNTFLDHFGLTKLEDLPCIDIQEDQEEKDLYISKYKEN